MKKKTSNTRTLKKKPTPPAKRILPEISLTMLIAGGVVTLLVVAMTFALVRFYAEPANSVVARVGNISIRRNDVIDEVFHVASTLAWDYVDMFPEDVDIDMDRIFRDGLTFGRVIREDAARMIAVYKLVEEFGAELGADFDHVTSPDDVIWGAAQLVMMNPDEAARFAPYMPDSPEEIEQQAMAILERAHAGEDFDLLVETYSHDSGAPAEGYTFVAGAMVGEFYEATKALEIGEISDLVRTQFGFHIIQRVEPNPDGMIMRNPEIEPDEDEYLLGAKHILVPSEITEEIDDTMRAVFSYFEARRDEIGVRFTRALDNIPLDFHDGE